MLLKVKMTPAIEFDRRICKMSNTHNVTLLLSTPGCQWELKDCWINCWGKINQLLFHRPFNICPGFPMYILNTRSPNRLTLLKTWSKLIIYIADMSWRAYWGGLEHYNNTVVCSDGAGEGLFYRCSLVTVKPSYWTVLRPPAVSGLRSQLPLFGVRPRSCMPSRLYCNDSLACTVFILNPTIHSRCQTALLMFCSAIRVSVRLLSVCLVMSPTINDAVVQLLPLRHV